MLFKKALLSAVLLSFSLSTWAKLPSLSLSCPTKTLSKHQAQYLFIGENHFDPQVQTFFENISDEFKLINFDTIFTEFIESRDQKILDRFNQNPVDNFNLAQSTYAQPGDWGYDSSKYTGILVALKKAELEIRGLDRRSDSELKFMLNQDLKMAIRDHHMFEVVKEYIEKFPNKKIIFFNGSSHSYKNSNTEGASFFELFVNSFPNKKVMNLKLDYLKDYSSQRNRLSFEDTKPNLNCQSGFIFYQDKKASEFDYYIFKDNARVYPIQDYTGEII